MNRAPWMASRLEQGECGPELHIGCLYCAGALILPAPEQMPVAVIVRQTRVFQHAEACIVPARLERARAAFRN